MKQPHRGSQKSAGNSLANKFISLSKPVFSGDYPFLQIGKGVTSIRQAVLCGFMLLVLCLWPVSGSASADLLIRRITELAKPLLENAATYRFDVKASFQSPVGVNEPMVDSVSAKRHHAHLTIFRSAEQDWGIRLTTK